MSRYLGCGAGKENDACQLFCPWENLKKDPCLSCTNSEASKEMSFPFSSPRKKNPGCFSNSFFYVISQRGCCLCNFFRAETQFPVTLQSFQSQAHWFWSSWCWAHWWQKLMELSTSDFQSQLLWGFIFVTQCPVPVVSSVGSAHLPSSCLQGPSLFQSQGFSWVHVSISTPPILFDVACTISSGGALGHFLGYLHSFGCYLHVGMGGD